MGHEVPRGQGAGALKWVSDLKSGLALLKTASLVKPQHTLVVAARHQHDLIAAVAKCGFYRVLDERDTSASTTKFGER